MNAEDFPLTNMEGWKTIEQFITDTAVKSWSEGKTFEQVLDDPEFQKVLGNVQEFTDMESDNSQDDPVISEAMSRVFWSFKETGLSDEEADKKTRAWFLGIYVRHIIKVNNKEE